MNVDELKWSVRTISPNVKYAPCNVFRISEEGMNQFNEMLQWCEDKIGKERRIEWTPSGGMKKNGICDRYGIRRTSSSVELVIYYHCKLTRCQFRNAPKSKDGKKVIYGSQAFQRFRSIMEDFGVDIEDYAVSPEEGKKIKETIPKVRIEMIPTIHGVEILSGDVHHMDLNSSYLSGMAVFEPEWKPALDWMYEHRKDNDTMKNVMVETTGYMQSVKVKASSARWAHFSKAGIEWNNMMIDMYAKKLIKNGDKILGFNTDGIWYKGPLFHDELEGEGLGKWKNDHTYCKAFRAKSNGAYEFIDSDGKYYPVLRGCTKLDMIKDRDDWEWGDIFRTEIIEFIWNEEAERVVKL